ncbi:hypothetical protein ACFL1M_02545 [Patescibacteria group bacterium]
MKKLLSIFLVALSFFVLISPTPIFAQDEGDVGVNSMGSDKPLNVYKYTDHSGSAMVTKGVCLTVGCQTTDTNEVIDQGAVQYINDQIAFLTTNPPVTGKLYIADVMQNFGVAPQAYAQGIGFSALSPVLNIWKAFRNMAYFLFIVVFVGIGFMIMFRTQINHQYVVTAQMALPKIILTLVLISFSYAIAGFIVDLIYFSIFLMINILARFGIINSPADAINALLSESLFSIGAKYLVFDGIGGSGAATVGGQAITDVVFGALPWWIDWLPNGFFTLIIGIAILIAMMRTFFQIIMAYVGIIMSTILAPLQLMGNAMPGSEAFSNWIKGLLANAMVFPAIALMLILGVALTGADASELGIESTGQATFSDTTWNPPFIGNKRDRTAGSVQGIVGIGMIMLLPTVSQITKQMFASEGSPVLGSAVGGVLQPINMLVGGYQKVTQHRYQKAMTREFSSRRDKEKETHG